jgi:sterol 3beta-glucosyltransferase
MRICLSTIGSDGDVQPYLALGKRLIAAGHDVRLAAVGRYAARSAAVGVPFVEIGRSWDDEVMEARFGALLQVKDPMRQLVMIMEIIKDPLIEMVPELTELLRGHDLVITHPMSLAAIVAARVSGTPFITGHLGSLIRSRNINPLGSDLGPFLNGLLWSVMRWMLRRSTDGILNEVVAAGGLPPWRDILFEANSSPLLDLLAVSPEVIPRDPLWPERYVGTGYWFLEEPSFVPDPALAAFVEAEPPVVITFGSMGGVDAAKYTKKLADGVRGLGRRVILQAGWARLGEGELPENMSLAGFVPHGWLFTRAACVVHHGGAGTTAAALRAGVPQVVVWHMGDQPSWGKMVERLGVGAKPRPHLKLEGAWLGATLRKVLADEAMAGRARALGAKIRAEDGTGVAVARIEAAMRAR